MIENSINTVLRCEWNASEKSETDRSRVCKLNLPWRKFHRNKTDFVCKLAENESLLPTALKEMCGKLSSMTRKICLSMQFPANDCELLSCPDKVPFTFIIKTSAKFQVQSKKKVLSSAGLAQAGQQHNFTFVKAHGSIRSQREKYAENRCLPDIQIIYISPYKR